MKYDSNKRLNGWPSKKIDLLKELYPSTPNEDIEKKLGYSLSAIRSKAFKLGLKKENRHWSKKEEEWLLKKWDTTHSEKIAEHLKKTKWAVINKYRELTGKR